MNFINKEYDDKVLSTLFKGDKNQRVRFDAFFQFLEVNSIHEMTPEQFKSELDLFDEDRNGCAQIEDVNRVLQTYTDMSEADR